MTTFATNFVSCSAVNEKVWFVLSCRRMFWPTIEASPCIMCVQYIGGCSVHQGVFSTLGGYHEYIGGIS